MRLPKVVYENVKERGVEVFFADRWTCKWWNERRNSGELRFYGGWYWWVRGETGLAETMENGPFKTESAAYRDAAEKLQVSKVQTPVTHLPRKTAW